MEIMRCRDFLRLSALASGSALLARQSLSAPVSNARLTIDPTHVGNTIGPDFTGLSYETAQLGDPDFFSPANSELVGLVRRLGHRGVLRIGGNTSETSRWTSIACCGLTRSWRLNSKACLKRSNNPDCPCVWQKPTLAIPEASRV